MRVYINGKRQVPKKTTAKKSEAYKRDRNGRFSDRMAGWQFILVLLAGSVLAVTLWKLDAKFNPVPEKEYEYVSPIPDDGVYEMEPPHSTPSERKATTSGIYNRTLEAYGSPLAGLGTVIYEIEEEYQIPHYLLLAMAGQESTFGTRGSNVERHNPLGWGPRMVFNSWEEAFRTVASKLASLPAYSQWREEKDNVALLALTYNPQDGPKTWVQGVNHFRSEMIAEGFVKEAK